VILSSSIVAFILALSVPERRPDPAERDQIATESASPSIPTTPNPETTVSTETPTSSTDAPSPSPRNIDITTLSLGEPAKDIKIPYYADDGITLRMLLAAAEARRISDTDIEIKDLIAQARDEGDKKFTATFPTAVLNVQTHTLIGGEGVTIEREDITITGDRAELHLGTRLGKLFGNIRMTITNLEEQQ